MKYDAKAKAMWLIFRKSFEENLTYSEYSRRLRKKFRARQRNNTVKF